MDGRAGRRGCCVMGRCDEPFVVLLRREFFSEPGRLRRLRSTCYGVFGGRARSMGCDLRVKIARSRPVAMVVAVATRTMVAVRKEEEKRCLLAY